jgi:hypothetical protein
MSSIGSQSLLSHVLDPYATTTLATAASGRGGFALVAFLVAVVAFTMASGMAGAFRAALDVAVGVFATMLRVAGIGVVAIVVVVLLLLM